MNLFDKGWECPKCGAVMSPTTSCWTDMPKITKCTGEGQGSCKRCTDNGKWNRTWMCFLNEIEGYEGCYCNDCTNEIVKECEENGKA